MDDELQEIRDHFYIGSFTRCLDLIQNVHVSGEFQEAELASIKARTFLGMRKFGELKAMKDSSIPGEQAAAFMTIFLNSVQEKQKTQAKEQMLELANRTKDLNATAMAAILLAHQGEFVEAINLISTYDTLDIKALRTQIYFLMRRPDLADPVIKEMNQTAEDSAVTKMVTSLHNIATGNHQEAFLTYCDLQALYGEESNETPSTILLAAKAGCNLHRGLYTEALEDLQSALSVNNRDADSLINMASVSVHMDKDWEPHFNSLKEKNPSHPFVAKMNALTTAFDTFA